MSVREGADSTMSLRDGDGVADATEGIVASIATAGGNDKIVFAAGDRVVKDDFGDDGSAFEDFRLLDDLRLVEAASITLLQPEALVGLGSVHYDVVSRNADGVVRDDCIRCARFGIEGVVNADEPLGESVDRLDPRAHRLTVAVSRLDRALDEYAVRFGIDIPRRESSGEGRIERGESKTGGYSIANFRLTELQLPPNYHAS